MEEECRFQWPNTPGFLHSAVAGVNRSDLYAGARGAEIALAMQDLEIRCAGIVLGPDPSGLIASSLALEVCLAVPLSCPRCPNGRRLGRGSGIALW